MRLFTDGGCTGAEQKDISKRNMRAVVTDQNSIVLVNKRLTGGSNNIAELWAVSEALLFAESRGIDECDIFTDSKNNLAWLEHRVGQGLNDRVAVMNLLKTIDDLRTRIRLTATWIPREQNLAGIYIEQNKL
jgi:ribonuclease HI